MKNRRKYGKETWVRLRDWSEGPTAAERFVARLLTMEGLSGIDPSHPLGGPDRKKDAVCLRHGAKLIISVYFPSGKIPFPRTKAKLIEDVQGVIANNAKGIIFVTNQELTLAQREKLSEIVEPHKFELYHLERLAVILDTPPYYGLRNEFLSIDLNSEEQVSFFSSYERLSAIFHEDRRKLDDVMRESNTHNYTKREISKDIYIEQLVQFAMSIRFAVDAFFRVRNDRITRIQTFALFMKWEREDVYEILYGPSTFRGECFLEPEEHFLMILEDEIIAINKFIDLLIRLQTQYNRFLEDQVLKHYLDIQFWFSIFRNIANETIHNSRRAFEVVLRQLSEADSNDEKEEIIEPFVRGQGKVKELYWEHEISTIDGFCQLFNRFIEILPQSVVSGANLVIIDREQLLRILEREVGIQDDESRPSLD